MKPHWGLGKRFTTAATVAALLLSASTAVSAGGWGGYGHGHGRGYVSYGYHGHGHGNEGIALLSGLLIGGLVGYAISEDRYAYSSRAAYPVYATPVYPARRVEYVEYVREPVRVVRSVPVEPVVVESYRPAPEPAGCLQTREYTTTVTVDGREREAYGTRCLQANGTWLLGPAKLVPDF